MCILKPCYFYITCVINFKLEINFNVEILKSQPQNSIWIVVVKGIYIRNSLLRYGFIFLTYPLRVKNSLLKSNEDISWNLSNYWWLPLKDLVVLVVCERIRWSSLPPSNTLCSIIAAGTDFTEPSFFEMKRRIHISWVSKLPPFAWHWQMSPNPYT